MYVEKGQECMIFMFYQQCSFITNSRIVSKKKRKKIKNQPTKISTHWLGISKKVFH